MYNDFTEMSVWKLAMDYAVQIFNLTNNLPKREDYALTSQIRRIDQFLYPIIWLRVLVEKLN